MKPKRQRTIDKYRHVQKRFNDLYNVKRLRYDDTLKKLSQEFFMSVDTIQMILRTEV